MNWFDQFDIQKKKEIQMKLITIMELAHQSNEMITKAIQTAPLKNTITPIVLFKTLSFKIAYINRRETDCKNRCGHEWHNIKD